MRAISHGTPMRLQAPQEQSSKNRSIVGLAPRPTRRCRRPARPAHSLRAEAPRSLLPGHVVVELVGYAPLTAVRPSPALGSSMQPTRGKASQNCQEPLFAHDARALDLRRWLRRRPIIHAHAHSGSPKASFMTPRLRLIPLFSPPLPLPLRPSRYSAPCALSAPCPLARTHAPQR